MDPSQLSPRTSVRASLIENLTSQADLLPSFFNALTQPQSISSSASSSASSSKRPKSPTQIYSQLVTLDQQLASLLERTRHHQRRWEAMQAAKEETIRLEAQSLEFITQLEGARRRLVGVLRGANEVLGSVETSEKNPVQPSVLLEYASSLAPYTSAPPSYDPTQQAQPTNAFIPPFPTEHVMRRGRLNAASDQPLGIVGESKPTEGDAKEEAGTTSLYSEHARPRPNHHEIFDLDLNSDLSDLD